MKDSGTNRPVVPKAKLPKNLLNSIKYSSTTPVELLGGQDALLQMAEPSLQMNMDRQSLDYDKVLSRAAAAEKGLRPRQTEKDFDLPSGSAAIAALGIRTSGAPMQTPQYIKDKMRKKQAERTQTLSRRSAQARVKPLRPSSASSQSHTRSSASVQRPSSALPTNHSPDSHGVLNMNRRPQSAMGSLASHSSSAATGNGGQRSGNAGESSVHTKLYSRARLAGRHGSTGKRQKAGLASKHSSRAVSQICDEAVSARQAGSTVEAYSRYRKALKQQPHNSQVMMQVGSLLDGVGEIEVAVQLLRSAAFHAPKDFVAQYNLGVGLAHHGKYSEAALCFKKAIDLKPMAELYTCLAHCQRRNGLFREAMNSLHEAKKLPTAQDLVKAERPEIVRKWQKDRTLMAQARSRFKAGHEGMLREAMVADISKQNELLESVMTAWGQDNTPLTENFGAQKQAEAHRVDMFESQSEAGDDTIPIHFDGDEPSEDGSSGSSGDDSFGDDYDAMESGFDSFISNRRDTAYKVLTAFEDEEEEQRQLLEQHRLSDLPSPTHSNGSTPVGKRSSVSRRISAVYAESPLSASSGHKQSLQELSSSPHSTSKQKALIDLSQGDPDSPAKSIARHRGQLKRISTLSEVKDKHQISSEQTGSTKQVLNTGIEDTSRPLGNANGSADQNEEESVKYKPGFDGEMARKQNALAKWAYVRDWMRLFGAASKEAGTRSDRNLRVITERLQPLDFMKKLPLFIIKRMAQCMKIRTFHGNQPVISQGDMGNSLYILLYGPVVVRVHMNLSPGQVAVLEESKIVGGFGPGKVFGEIALVSQQPRAAFIIPAASDDGSVPQVSVLELKKLDYDRIRKTFERDQLNERVRFLEKNMHFSAGMAQEQLKRLAATLKPVSYKPNTVICRQGDSMSRMLLLSSGSVALFRNPNTYSMHDIALRVQDESAGSSYVHSKSKSSGKMAESKMAEDCNKEVRSRPRSIFELMSSDPKNHPPGTDLGKARRDAAKLYMQMALKGSRDSTTEQERARTNKAFKSIDSLDHLLQFVKQGKNGIEMPEGRLFSDRLRTQSLVKAHGQPVGSIGAGSLCMHEAVVFTNPSPGGFGANGQFTVITESNLSGYEVERMAFRETGRSSENAVENDFVSKTSGFSRSWQGQLHWRGYKDKLLQTLLKDRLSTNFRE